MVTQEEINIAFEKIVKLAQDMDMVLPQAPVGEDEKLTTEQQRKQLAVLARYISEGHPGFATNGAENISFSDDVKNKFKTEFVKMYLKTKEERTISEIGKELFKFTKKYIPDNHFNVFSTNGQPIGMLLNKEEHKAFKDELSSYLQDENIDTSQRAIIEHLYAQRNQVGKNLYGDEEIAQLQQNGAEIISDKKGKTWRMTEINHQDKNLMMIGMTQFVAMDNAGNLSEDIIKDFTALAKEFSKQEYKDCDALVLDLRGNGGGWPYLGDYIARTLYGNTVSTEPKGHIKMDTLAAKLSYAYMENKDVIARKKLINEENNTQYNQKETSWQETYPFNSKIGYTKPILVLTDQNTGSNAELTIARLKEHPYVRTIGDHSCGVIQYHPAATPKAAIPLPYGLKIALPPEGFTGSNGERLEGVGYVPDYQTPKGDNALLMALDEFDNINANIKQNLPLEQTVNTQAKREDKVDETTALNRARIEKNNPSMLKAFDELVNATSVIPQLKSAISKQNAQNKSLE